MDTDCGKSLKTRQSRIHGASTVNLGVVVLLEPVNSSDCSWAIETVAERDRATRGSQLAAIARRLGGVEDRYDMLPTPSVPY
jgi:hypothetical protein